MVAPTHKASKVAPTTDKEPETETLGLRDAGNGELRESQALSETTPGACTASSAIQTVNSCYSEASISPAPVLAHDDKLAAAVFRATSSRMDTSYSIRTKKWARRKCRRWCWGKLNPEKSRFLMRWDLCSALLLVVIAVMTPFEAAFLVCSESLTPRWLINQAINMFFFLDFLLQFFVPFPVPTRYGQRFIYDTRAIVCKYVRSWMLVDFISIVPYEIIAPCGGVSALRTVRLLRLMKLLRLLRGMRIIQRWQAEAGISYRKTMLYRLFVMVLIASHWIACALGLASRFQGDSCLNYLETDVDGCVITWLTTANLKPSEVDAMTPGTRDTWGTYLLALHASMSILVHPHHYMPTGSAERLLFIFLMLIGGFIWTQVISRSTAICTSLDRHNIVYQQLLDDVNTISSDLGLSPTTRLRLRKFFYRTKQLSQTETWEAIMKRMSPQLRRDTSRELNKFWVLRIRFLTKCSIAFITDVSEALRVQMFSEAENFGEVWHLYILMEGLATRTTKLKVIAPGAVWGEDHLLLTCQRILTDNHAVAMVYVQCQVLAKERFEQIVSEYPEHEKFLRKARIRQAFIRGMKFHCEDIRRKSRIEAHTLTGGGRASLGSVFSSESKGFKIEDHAADARQRAKKARVTRWNCANSNSDMDQVVRTPSLPIFLNGKELPGGGLPESPTSQTQSQLGGVDLVKMAETLEKLTAQVASLAEAQREMAAKQAWICTACRSTMHECD